jgi:hypothetical protein
MLGTFALTPGLNLFGEGSLGAAGFGGTDLILDGRGQLDADGLSFITAAANLSGGAAIALSDTQQNAIHFLVAALKWQASTISGTLWSRSTAIYPFLGADGTGTGGKLNALDLKGAFPCTLNGALTHNANGVTGNGSTGYLNTGLTPAASLTLNNQHLSVYSRTKGAAVSTLIGADNVTAVSMLKFTSATGLNWGIDTGSSANDVIQDQGEFFVTTKTASNVSRAFRGVKFVGSNPSNPQALITVPFYICARNANNTPSEFSSNNIAFASIGLGLSDVDVKNFYRIVRSFQSFLGRRV